MKLQNKIVIILTLIILGVNQNYAQSLTIQVFEPLPQIDFATFATSNDLSGTPRIFSVQINPKGMEVSFEGVVQWQQNENSGYEHLFSFTTELFTARDFYNDNIGNDIVIKSTNSNSNLVTTNIQLGKPTGNYKIIGTLFDADGQTIATDTKTLSFVNPAQTLSILSPDQSSYQDAYSVIASWTEIIGADNYRVIANVRKNRGQSPEEALRAGTQYVNRNVGLTNVVNLRSIIDREWLPGDEIVLQIIADVPGPNGGNHIESNIINFYLNNISAEEIKSFTSQLSDLSSNPSLNQLGDGLLNKLANGELTIQNILNPDGTPMSAAEIEALLEYIRQNPDLVISMTKIE